MVLLRLLENQGRQQVLVRLYDLLLMVESKASSGSREHPLDVEWTHLKQLHLRQLDAESNSCAVGCRADQ